MSILHDQHTLKQSRRFVRSSGRHTAQAINPLDHHNCTHQPLYSLYSTLRSRVPESQTHLTGPKFSEIPRLISIYIGSSDMRRCPIIACRFGPIATGISHFQLHIDFSWWERCNVPGARIVQASNPSLTHVMYPLLLIPSAHELT